MALTGSYVLANNRIPEVFSKIRDGQAPDQVTRQLLKDWGFSSSNDRAFIPLLKSLGFLSQTGQPTQRYHDYRDHSKSKSIMAEAIREAYGDLFLISSNPKEADRDAIKGKFKSYHNASDNTAQNMTASFYALLKLADLSSSSSGGQKKTKQDPGEGGDEQEVTVNHHRERKSVVGTEFHYNIQIHLPATKDIEVYNAIFKSLREHFVE